MAKRLLGGLGSAGLLYVLTGTAAPLATTGCFGHQCDPSFARLEPSVGRLVDENTWESGPIEGEWLDYAPQRWITIPLAQLGNRLPTSVLVYVSGNSRPVGSASQSSFALATGNLASIQWVSSEAIMVHNDTCAQYFARVVISVASPASAAADAAVAADAGDAK